LSLCYVLFFWYPSTTAIYTLSLHDALPISTMTILDGSSPAVAFGGCGAPQSYPDGAKIEFVGTCTEMVNINHGSLVVNSSNEIVIENAIIFENTASGSAAPLPTTNSILSGTT